MAPSDDRGIPALMSLLDDPDPDVQATVQQQLLQIGPAAVPSLRTIVEREGDRAVRAAARRALRAIGMAAFRGSIRELVAGTKGGDIDLEKGAFAVARVAWPDLDEAPYRRQLDDMASEVASRLIPDGGPMETMRTLNGYLVEQMGFHGCRAENFYEPDNSFLNRVLERRIGIPISLSVVYLLIASRLGLPLYGVGFPTHFLLTWRAPTTEFYVDAYAGGVILDRDECRGIIEALGLDPRPEFLAPASNRSILARMVRNLIEIYTRDEPQLSAELETAVVLVAEG